jgi:hypothetical protein
MMVEFPKILGSDLDQVGYGRLRMEMSIWTICV